MFVNCLFDYYFKNAEKNPAPKSRTKNCNGTISKRKSDVINSSRINLAKENDKRNYGSYKINQLTNWVLALAENICNGKMHFTVDFYCHATTLSPVYSWFVYVSILPKWFPSTVYTFSFPIFILSFRSFSIFVCADSFDE